MEIATLARVLDHPREAAEHLRGWGLADSHRAQQTLLELADSGLTLDLLAALCAQLGRHLPELPDPDWALDSLRRFLLAARSPLALVALFDRDGSALPMLLKALALGPAWQALLLADPEAFDLLRMTEGQPSSREALIGEACAELAPFSDERSIVAALRRIKQRQTLRIAYGDLVGRQRLELVTQQLTWLAEAVVEAALTAATRKAAEQRAASRGPAPEPRVAVVALGRLGGSEMDYRADIELLLMHDAPGEGESGRGSAEHFERVARWLIKFLSETAHEGPIYRVRLVTLPDSQSNPLVHAADDAVLGFDSFGRTWHRQALLKARPIAGDRVLAEEVLTRLAPWIYRRYLNRADETGIKALQRRLLRRGASADEQACNPVHGRGGLADIEGVVGFLQLLTGGDRQAVRRGGTLATIAGLEQAGVLAIEERTLLEESYAWLRQVEHRLQVMLGPAVTDLPADEQTLAAIARSLGLTSEGPDFMDAVRARLAQVWQVLSRLLTLGLSEEPPPAVVDLLLAPAPSPEEAATALAGYGLADPFAAAGELSELARERVPFLSTRRCRHFLSLIAERLLQEIAVTPDPDGTLVNLGRVSDSLGGKGVLWELLNFHPPSLQLYVRLCAASPYLSGILTTNPGMIDDLVDSLLLDRLPTRAELEASLAELSRGVGDVLPILHDLKNSSHLRIGIRDILGKDAIEATHAALADVAEFSLSHLVDREHAYLVDKFGQPTHGPGSLEGEPCHLTIVGLGKLGGREPNYHSQVEVAFLYEAEGTTQPRPRTRQQRTTNSHFFTQLAQRVLREASQLTPKGRLATIDVLLQPIGSGGGLALPLDDFAQHFRSGAAPLWQWQALCKARPIHGAGPFRASAANLIEQLLASRAWRDGDQAELYRARIAAERGASELNLKRGRGGTLDIECLAQMLQLRHAADSRAALVKGTQDALAALAAAGHLARDDAEYLSDSYRFLRRIESGLRLLNTSARHDLSEDPLQLGQLALLLGQPNGDTIRDRAIITLAENRRRFERIFAATGEGTSR